VSTTWRPFSKHGNTIPQHDYCWQNVVLRYNHTINNKVVNEKMSSQTSCSKIQRHSILVSLNYTMKMLHTLLQYFRWKVTNKQQSNILLHYYTVFSHVFHSVSMFLQQNVIWIVPNFSLCPDCTIQLLITFPELKKHFWGRLFSLTMPWKQK
jgi:hypothetical protein